jgi:hypothetical protein
MPAPKTPETTDELLRAVSAWFFETELELKKKTLDFKDLSEAEVHLYRAARPWREMMQVWLARPSPPADRTRSLGR